MIKLSKQQIENKITFIEDYQQATNAAEASKFDSNANVTSKNIATLEAELYKDYNIQINRAILSKKIAELYGEDLAQEYNRQLEDHEIYTHDETSLKPYCCSITMYPFLIDGLTKLGGESLAPKHLESFCGSFVNLVFAISSQFAGALATVEFLMYFDYFARKDYGDDYLVVAKDKIENHLQHVVYAINQPASARGYQSVFWNVSVFDEYYFKSMFGDFAFPDENFTKPEWESVKALQEFFLTWFNAERTKSILTFPVVTAALLTEDGKVKDREFLTFCAKENAEGNSFFVYLSDSVDSLSSCCRLRNEFSDNTFSYSLGAGGVSTGSINVITMNMNRIIQRDLDLADTVQKIQKYQVAYRKVVEEYMSHKMLTVYDAGFISLDKQFLTLGINGMVEAAEFLGYEASNNQKYIDFVSSQLKIIHDLNKQAYKETGYKFNTEFVPAENLGVKNAKWDKKDGYKINRKCYNSYFFPVEDTKLNVIDKIILHGKPVIQYLDGGSALHLNLEEYLTQEAYIKLYDSCALAGCNYFTTNVKITICNSCGNIDKNTLKTCPECKSNDVDYATRIIGYLKRVGAFSEARQKEEKSRHYN